MQADELDAKISMLEQAVGETTLNARLTFTFPSEK
jgi:hypothetical protein